MEKAHMVTVMYKGHILFENISPKERGSVTVMDF